MPPITKFWIITLREPPETAKQDPALRTCFQDLLDFCSNASGTEHAAHGFWADLDAPQQLVMITGYPSEESNQAADREYVASGRLQTMNGFVQHRRLLQVDVAADALPLDAEELLVRTRPCRCGREPTLRTADGCGPAIEHEEEEEHEGDRSALDGDGSHDVGRHGVEMEMGKYKSNAFVSVLKATSELAPAGTRSLGDDRVLRLKKFLPS